MPALCLQNQVSLDLEAEWQKLRRAALGVVLWAEQVEVLAQVNRLVDLIRDIELSNLDC
jgi:hypothetical protein